MILRWLLYVVLAIWAARLARLMRRPPARGQMSDFHPGDGATHPSGSRQRGPDGEFAAGEIVDGEFEDVPGSRRP
jgi:hypothetical protein